MQKSPYSLIGVWGLFYSISKIVLSLLAVTELKSTPHLPFGDNNISSKLFLTSSKKDGVSLKSTILGAFSDNVELAVFESHDNIIR